ncbi:MAG TPA: hypothetical protein VI685_16110 [Candidatus Angelobacter sp.]
MSFISRSRFDDMLREKNTQIGYRDRRIAELEAERRVLWDKICLLGIGATVFQESVGQATATAQAPQQTEASEPSKEAGKFETIPARLPSMIMRRMDRLAEERWLRKVRPAKTAERQRDEVMNELNTAHMDGVKAGRR